MSRFKNQHSIPLHPIKSSNPVKTKYVKFLSEIHNSHTFTIENHYLALNIKNPRADELVVELVTLTGETETQVVIQALQERLDRIRTQPTQKCQIEALRKIARECAALPVLDNRSADEILGYDDDGLPT